MGGLACAPSEHSVISDSEFRSLSHNHFTEEELRFLKLEYNDCVNPKTRLLSDERLKKLLPDMFGFHSLALQSMSSAAQAKKTKASFKEFVVLFDKLIKQENKNVGFIFELLGKKMSEGFQLLEMFFRFLFELFSESPVAVKPDFRFLYFNYNTSRKRNAMKNLVKFVVGHYPNVSKLISAYFYERVFGRKATYVKFSPSNLVPFSILTIEHLFSMYLSNNQFCFGKAVKPYMIYSTISDVTADSDQIGILISLSTSDDQRSVLYSRANENHRESSDEFEHSLLFSEIRNHRGVLLHKFATM